MRAVDEMYLASLINKGKAAYTRGTTDPTALPAENILKMATINGAQSVLWEDEIGSLEVGKKVKIYCLGSPAFHFLSLHFTNFLGFVS
jgi:cytosine/adenosine deaminase-related metal-dependent hydrolase